MVRSMNNIKLKDPLTVVPLLRVPSQNVHNKVFCNRKMVILQRTLIQIHPTVSVEFFRLFETRCLEVRLYTVEIVETYTNRTFLETG